MDLNPALMNTTAQPNPVPLRVLIVEDNPADAELMILRLNHEGFHLDWQRVETEPDYLKALDTPRDLILSDWILPQFSGQRALQLLIERGLEVPFILVSGGIGEETAVAVMRQGAADYIKKDRMDRLGQAVKNALEQKRLKDENKQAMQALSASEAKLRGLFASMQDLVLVLDREGTYREIAPTHPDLLVRPAQELLGKRLQDVFPADQAAEFIRVIQQVLNTQQTRYIEYKLLIQNRLVWFETSISPMSDQNVIWVARDISERKQAQAQIQLQAAALASTANAIVITDHAGKIEWVNPAYTALTGYAAKEVIGQNPRILKSGKQDQLFYQQLWQTILAGQTWQGELVNKRKDGSFYNEEQTISPLREADGQISKFIGIKQDITRRKQTEQSLWDLLQIQSQIAALGRELADTRDLTTICQISYRTLKQMVDVAYFSIALMNADKLSLQVVYTIQEDVELDPHTYPILDLANSQPSAICIRTIQGRKPIVSTNRAEIQNGPVSSMGGKNGQEMRSACCLPMLAEDQVIGLIGLQSAQENAYTPEDLEWLGIMANQVGLSIQNAMYYSTIQQRVDELSALAVIDSAVLSHFEPQKMYATILEQVIIRLKVDAAVLFLFQPKSQMLECVSEAGYHDPKILQLRLQLGESLAGKTALDRQLLHLNLDDPKNASFMKRNFQLEGFKDYYGLPLVADGQLIGVLEVLHRSRLTPNEDWQHFLETLANQTAIALNTTRLYDYVQNSHNELLNAYDLTIEGWSKAMDLRDKETENHTRRVTEMTQRLAQRFGIGEDQMVHLRRGALLHDIGKLGVPDQILLKPGGLTEEEWEMMRRHPQLAYDMLFPIEYLRPALDIPYCHHEKWDGTGYPRGLKGEEIPFAARLFAVVDVYDALTSDRPYRAAWSKEKALQYISEQSGKHFDPRVVDAFLSLLQTGELHLPV
jgi:PAS domain S-box-containing protein